MFPYPDVLGEENKENLTAMVDAFTGFFENENDPLHNDQICTVPDEVMKGMSEMGAFGLQVPEELEGLGLNNTEYARLTEIVGQNDLGVGIVMGAHQSIGFKVRFCHLLMIFCHNSFFVNISLLFLFSGYSYLWKRRAKSQIFT